MAKIPRFFLPSTQFSDSHLTLRRQDKHYLMTVLRKREGDRFVALDGAGRAWLCELQAERAIFLEHYPMIAPLTPKLTVAVALCKGSRFEGAVEKLAELGVARLIPLHTDRAERKAPSSNRLSRWQEIANSSSALAYRSIPLELSEPRDLDGVLQDGLEDLFYCHPGGASPGECFPHGGDTFTLLIGPEGGFSPAEAQKLSARGKQLDLGPLNLRVETAAVVAASMALNLSAEKRV